MPSRQQDAPPLGLTEASVDLIDASIIAAPSSPTSAPSQPVEEICSESLDLLVAAENGLLDEVVALLDARADVHKDSGMDMLPKDGATKKKKTKLDRMTALIAAASNGHSKVVQVLLDAKTDVDATTKNDETALSTAAANGHSNVVRTLLACNPLPDLSRSSLVVAIDRGHMDVVKILMPLCGDGAILSAGMSGSLEQMATLLHASESARELVFGKESALVMAIQSGNEGIVKLLLEAKVGFSARPETNSSLAAATEAKATGSCVGLQTPPDDECSSEVFNLPALMTAVLSTHSGRMCKLLLDHKVNVNEPCYSTGATALSYAASKGDVELTRLLLDAKANVHATSKEGRSVLLFAALKGHTDAIALLLDAKADVHAADEAGRTALMEAVNSGRAEAVGLLLDAKADANARDEDGDTPLVLAASNGHSDVVKVLVGAGRQVDIDCEDKDGDTPLILAASKGDSDVVRMLLEAGANVNKTNLAAEAAIILAARKGHADVTQLLLDANAEVSEMDDTSALSAAAMKGHTAVVRVLLDAKNEFNANISVNGSPALFVSIARDYQEITRLLLDAEVDVNICHQGMSPLTLAVNSQSKSGKEVVEMLLEAKADIYNTSDKASKTLLSLAKRMKTSEVYRMLINAAIERGLYDAALHGAADVVEELLAGKVDVNAPSESGSFPLLAAAQNGHSSIVSCLLHAQADLLAHNKIGSTALHLAAHNGHDKVVKVLLRGKASVDVCDKMGATAVHAAALRGHGLVVAALLRANADVRASDKVGMTALHGAARLGHLEVVQGLLHSKADVHAPNKNGLTAAHLAAQIEHKKAMSLGGLPTNAQETERFNRETRAIQQQRDVVKALLAANANVDVHGIEHWYIDERMAQDAKDRARKEMEASVLDLACERDSLAPGQEDEATHKKKKKKSKKKKKAAVQADSRAEICAANVSDGAAVCEPGRSDLHSDEDDSLPDPVEAVSDSEDRVALEAEAAGPLLECLPSCADDDAPTGAAEEAGPAVSTSAGCDPAQGPVLRDVSSGALGRRHRLDQACLFASAAVGALVSLRLRPLCAAAGCSARHLVVSVFKLFPEMGRWHPSHEADPRRWDLSFLHAVVLRTFMRRRGSSDRVIWNSTGPARPRSWDQLGSSESRTVHCGQCELNFVMSLDRLVFEFRNRLAHYEPVDDGMARSGVRVALDVALGALDALPCGDGYDEHGELAEYAKSMVERLQTLHEMPTPNQNWTHLPSAIVRTETGSIGAGAQAMVFPGTLHGSLPVALKRCFLAQNDRSSLERELECLCTIIHPNIVKLYGYAEVESIGICLVLHREDCSLADYMADQRLSLAEAVHVARGVAQGLQHLHTVCDIVHRDIKPPNILIQRSNLHPTITDFGTATFEVATVTRTHGLVGTPAYMAPELFDEDTRCNASVDVYSFGVVVNEMVSGVPPFAGKSLMAVFKLVAVGERRPDPAQGVEELVTQCWAQDPEARPGWEAVLKMLDSIAAG